MDKYVRQIENFIYFISQLAVGELSAFPSFFFHVMRFPSLHSPFLTAPLLLV